MLFYIFYPPINWERNTVLVLFLSNLAQGFPLFLYIQRGNRNGFQNFSILFLFSFPKQHLVNDRQWSGGSIILIWVNRCILLSLTHFLISGKNNNKLMLIRIPLSVQPHYSKYTSKEVDGANQRSVGPISRPWKRKLPLNSSIDFSKQKQMIVVSLGK